MKWDNCPRSTCVPTPKIGCGKGPLHPINEITKCGPHLKDRDSGVNQPRVNTSQFSRRVMASSGDGIAQWVSLKIKNLIGNAPIQIKDASIDSGKFYEGDDKSKEISSSGIDQIVIAPSQTGTVSACGREGAMVGTEGRISLYEGSTKICTLYWDCPYWSSANTFNAESVDSAYSVTVGDWNHGPGAIGNVYIEIERL